MASVAVVMDAKDDRAVTFYRRYDFIPFADQEQEYDVAAGEEQPPLPAKSSTWRS